MIEVHSTERIDIEKIKTLNVSRILQTKDGINIDVGTSAYIVAKVINDSVTNAH